ncbi:MAG: CaiB/BaiF CoA-transferase family protein, partial [Pseudomonadota bacterium]
RNKKSILLNLRAEKGLEVFYKLAEKSDVLIENSRPGTMEKLRIGYAKLSEINPRLIYCSVSGYGQTGPYKMIPGHDSNYLSISGVLSMIGEKDGPPVMPSNLVADMAGAGMFPLAGILIALMAREKTGRGQFLDMSYMDGVASMAGFETAMYLLTGMEPRRGEFLRGGSEPFLHTYKTKDGKWFNIACLEPNLWRNLCKALDREDLIPQQWTGDPQKKEEMFTFFRETFLTRTRDEWWEWAKDKDIAASPVLELVESFDDPQIRDREMILELDHPTLGKVKQAGFPLKLSETPGRFKDFGPTPGRDTLEVLQGLGYTEKDIEALRQAGAI